MCEISFIKEHLKQSSDLFIFISIIFSLPVYREYKNRTSPLILVPPPLYAALNKYIKAIFCCEFPIYNKMSDEPGEGSYIKQPQPQGEKGSESV